MITKFPPSWVESLFCGSKLRIRSVTCGIVFYTIFYSISIITCIVFPWSHRMVSVYPEPNLFFKCWMDPRHLNCPFTMMPGNRKNKAKQFSLVALKCLFTCRNMLRGYTPRREHKASHSSIECEVRTTDWPPFIISKILFHKNLLAPGSIPLVGSS